VGGEGERVLGAWKSERRRRIGSLELNTGQIGKKNGRGRDSGKTGIGESLGRKTCFSANEGKGRRLSAHHDVRKGAEDRTE